MLLMKHASFKSKSVVFKYQLSFGPRKFLAHWANNGYIQLPTVGLSSSCMSPVELPCHYQSVIVLYTGLVSLVCPTDQ